MKKAFSKLLSKEIEDKFEKTKKYVKLANLLITTNLKSLDTCVIFLILIICVIVEKEMTKPQKPSNP